jgi:hypothetical protein
MLQEYKYTQHYVKQQGNRHTPGTAPANAAAALCSLNEGAKQDMLNHLK